MRQSSSVFGHPVADLFASKEVFFLFVGTTPQLGVDRFNQPLVWPPNLFHVVLPLLMQLLHTVKMELLPEWKHQGALAQGCLTQMAAIYISCPWHCVKQWYLSLHVTPPWNTHTPHALVAER